MSHRREVKQNAKFIKESNQVDTYYQPTYQKLFVTLQRLL